MVKTVCRNALRTRIEFKTAIPKTCHSRPQTLPRLTSSRLFRDRHNCCDRCHPHARNAASAHRHLPIPNSRPCVIASMERIPRSVSAKAAAASERTQSRARIAATTWTDKDRCINNCRSRSRQTSIRTLASSATSDSDSFAVPKLLRPADRCRLRDNSDGRCSRDPTASRCQNRVDRWHKRHRACRVHNRSHHSLEADRSGTIFARRESDHVSNRLLRRSRIGLAACVWTESERRLRA